MQSFHSTDHGDEMSVFPVFKFLMSGLLVMENLVAIAGFGTMTTSC